MSYNIDKSFITKAEVIGVNGIIILERDGECVNIESALPILALNQKDWEVLLTMGQKLEKEARILLNEKLGRLLIVKKQIEEKDKKYCNSFITFSGSG
jgi:hypothetical protein